MNRLFTFLTVALLLTGRIYSAPLDTTEFFDFTSDGMSTTPEPTTTTSTTTSTTTTTTPAPEADREWEDLILAGPAVVNYLGLFMVLASRSKQALVPLAGHSFTHIKNFESVSDILSQISLAMQATFKVARQDLIRTRTSMDQIPDHIKAGLLLIQTAPKDLLRQLLPYTLRNVDRAAKEGSDVTKPTLESFAYVGEQLDELDKLVEATLQTGGANTDYLVEAKAYTVDMKTQWDLLGQLFKKFSHRADITQGISNNLIDVIKEADSVDGFNLQKDRIDQLNKLIPATIAIDQSSHLLDMMARTYTEVSQDHMLGQIVTNKDNLALDTEPKRAASQRQLWQNTVAQSVKVARLAQERQVVFAETSPQRQNDYNNYLKGVLAA